jgi:hypothetical protein
MNKPILSPTLASMPPTAGGDVLGQSGVVAK